MESTDAGSYLRKSTSNQLNIVHPSANERLIEGMKRSPPNSNTEILTYNVMY